MSTELIEEYNARLRKHRASATVNEELQVIKWLFNKGHQWGRIAANPAANVEMLRVNYTWVRFPEPDEMTRIQRALPERLRPIFTFARFTGAGRGEILELRWNDLDIRRDLISLRGTKIGETGHVEMNLTMRAFLNSQPKPMSRSQVHDLRHQAVTDLLTLGADLNDVRDLLRHKSMAMTLRYGHFVRCRRSHMSGLLDRQSTSAQGTKPGTAGYRATASPASPSSSLA